MHSHVAILTATAVAVGERETRGNSTSHWTMWPGNKAD